MSDSPSPSALNGVKEAFSPTSDGSSGDRWSGLYPILVCFKIVGVVDVFQRAEERQKKCGCRLAASRSYQWVIVSCVLLHVLQILAFTVVRLTSIANLIEVADHVSAIMNACVITITVFVFFRRSKDIFRFFDDIVRGTVLPGERRGLTVRVLAYLVALSLLDGTYVVARMVAIVGADHLGRFFPRVFNYFGLFRGDEVDRELAFKVLLSASSVITAVALFIFGVTVVIFVAICDAVGHMVAKLSTEFPSQWPEEEQEAEACYSKMVHYHNRVLATVGKLEELFRCILFLWTLYMALHVFIFLPKLLDCSEFEELFRIANCTFLVMHGYLFVLFAWGASQIQEQSDQVRFYANMTIAAAPSSAQEAHFLLTKLSYPLTLTAYGMFNFSRNFILSTITGVFTFGTVVYQFFPNRECGSLG